MTLRLDYNEPGFIEIYSAFLANKRESDTDVRDTVASIIADVRARRDDALYDLTEKFDRFDARAHGLAISSDEVDAAVAGLDPDLLNALEHAAERIRQYHARQVPEGFDHVDGDGVRVGERWGPVDAVGLYVPGGLANYPSSVLMNALPAHVAGVKRVVMTVPTPDGVISPVVLAAARLAGVTEIYRIGGAQAVAALSYGTETIDPVSTIVGPGNAFVAEAKRQVFGQVGIDTIAGPSEILVIADGKNKPEWIAADLLSQAEHDTVAQSILITTDADFADQTAAAVDAHLEQLPKVDIAREAWSTYGAIITVPSLEVAASLSDQVAPEHLELAVEDPDALMAKITHAGAIFLGRMTPEALGDYIAGPNHVLPTARRARFSGGLSVYNFMKRTSFVGASARGIRAIGPDAAVLAHAENLDAHRLSIEIRLMDKDLDQYDNQTPD